ncbi:MAG: DNA repair protein RadC [Verrucomicrobiota bacterium]
MTRIKDMQASERPRERLQDKGASALSVPELIAILLRVGVEGKSAVTLGQELLKQAGSLDGLCRLSVEDITAVKGIGSAKAAQLKAAFELGARLASERIKAFPVETPEHVVGLLGDEMRQLDYESLRVILVNTRLHVKAVEEVSRGTINETVAHPRDVLRWGLLHRAYGILLVHNHPTGDPQPSNADLEFTLDVRDAAKLLQIEFLDHVILGVEAVGRQGYYSFKEAGYL